MKDVNDKVFVLVVLSLMAAMSGLFIYAASQTGQLSDVAKERIERHRQHLDD